MYTRLDPPPCKLHPGLPEEEPSALSCQTQRDCVYHVSSLYSVHLGSSFGHQAYNWINCIHYECLIRIVTCWRSYSGVLRCLLKGITVCPRCCMILAGVTLKTRRWDLRLALLYKIVTGHVAINPDQIGLVAADNRTRANHRYKYKFRAIGASSTGLRRYSFAVRTCSQ